MRGAQNGVADIRAIAHMDGPNALTIVQAGLVVGTDEAFAQHRLIDDAEHALTALMFQRDQRAPI